MFMRRARQWTRYLVAAVAMLVLSGCERKEPATPAPEKPTATPKTESTEGDTALDPMSKVKATALLVAADKFDGKEDKIIARCASCALGMDGKEEHSLEFMDYTFHFCNADCQKRFGKDIAKSVLELKIPDGK